MLKFNKFEMENFGHFGLNEFLKWLIEQVLIGCKIESFLL